MVAQYEVLVFVSEDELKTMSPEEKAKLFEIFIVDEGNTSHSLTFKECVENSESFYLSCVPNIDTFKTNTFTVKDFSRDFKNLYETKNNYRNMNETMFIIGIFVFLIAIS